MIKELVQILEQREIAETKFMERYFTFSSFEQLSKTQEKISLNKLLNMGNIILLGPVGSGKTEVLQHLQYKFTLEFLRYDSKTFPIYVNLALIKHNSINEIILLQLKTLHKSELKFKKILLLLDELDTTPGEYNESFINQISSILKFYSNIQIVVATRYLTQAQKNNLKDFTSVILLPLLSEQIKEYIIHYSLNGLYLYKRISESEFVTDLITNPLILKSILQYEEAIFSSNIIFDPIKIISYYIENALYHVTYNDLQYKEILNYILEQISINMLKNEYTGLAERELLSIINLYKENNPNFNFSPKEVLFDLIKSSLLIIGTNGLISYSHKVINEYFITDYLRKQVFGISDDIQVDRHNDIIIALRIFKNWDNNELVSLYERLRTSIEIEKGQIIPFYAKRGSLILVLIILGTSGAIYAFKKFAETFFSTLGEEAAKKLINSKKTPKIPSEIINLLPKWVRDNSEVKNQFISEFISHYAKKTTDALSDITIVKSAIKSIWLEELKPFVEEIEVDSLLATPLMQDHENKKLKQTLKEVSTTSDCFRPRKQRLFLSDCLTV
jgi:hypothetical protein